MSMHAPAAPRTPSASTALSVTGGRRPNRRRGGPIIVSILVVLVVAGVGIAGYAARGSFDGLFDDVTTATTGRGRVAVSTDLHGGVRWSMSEVPIEEDRTTPLPDGTDVTVSMWAADLDDMVELVGLFERRSTFDVDQAMAGSGQLYGGDMISVDTTEVQGFPARTGTLYGISVAGESGTGRMTMVLTDVAVVTVTTMGDDRRADDIDERHDDIVASLRFGDA